MIPPREHVTRQQCYTITAILHRVCKDRTGRYSSGAQAWSDADHADMKTVFDALCRVVRASMLNGQAVYIKNFGTVTFRRLKREPKAKPGRLRPSSDTYLKPAFRLDDRVRAFTGVIEKVPVVPGSNETSVFDQSPPPRFVSPVALRRRVGLPADFCAAVVADIFQCIVDLLSENTGSIKIDFHFGTFRFDQATKSVSFGFDKAFVEAIFEMGDAAEERNMHASTHRAFVATSRDGAQLAHAMTRTLRTPLPRGFNLGNTGGMGTARSQRNGAESPFVMPPLTATGTLTGRMQTPPVTPRQFSSRVGHIRRLATARFGTAPH